MLKIKNITVVNHDGRQQTDVLMENGKIVKMAPSIDGDMREIDGTGRYLVPGFIDMHIHGSARMDAMDADAEGLRILAQSLVKEGTTSFLPTTMTQSYEHIEAALQTIGAFTSQPDEAEIVGIHVEGPFVSKDRAGAQPLEYIVEPDLAAFEKWQKLSNGKIKEITLAPERPGGMEATKAISSSGVVVSIGHSDASFEQMEQAVQMGATQGTHLYNQMRPFHHRDPGVVGGTLLLPQLKAEIIVDFIHVHKDAVNLAYRMKGAEGIILITDAMRAKGMPYGDYDLGGQMVHVTETGAHLPNGALAGSVLRMNEAVKNIQHATNCTLEEIVCMSSYNAAMQLQLLNKGELAEGKDADAVILDESFALLATIKAGEIVFEA